MTVEQILRDYIPFIQERTLQEMAAKINACHLEASSKIARKQAPLNGRNEKRSASAGR